jgi:8-oxo-dGTP pyrophosphatase MutT (NUDIX family)
VTEPDLERLQANAESDGRRCCAGAVIFDPSGRMFVPKRAPDAALPNLWDIVGGHVEPGESLLDALHREVEEETGWTVVGDATLAFVSDWEIPGDPVGRREFDFVVRVDGDLDRPRLAPAEHVDARWVSGDEIAIFDENAGQDMGLLRRVAEAALSIQPGPAPRLPHATVFVDPVPPALATAREQWDPVMASLIAPHVTVGYPHEVADVDDMTARVEAAASAARPFALRLGELTHDGGPDRGIFVAVGDPEGGWARLRHAVAGPDADAYPPHVTVVHPRTSALGASAWRALAGGDLSGDVVVRELAVTAFAGDRWQTVARFPLG